MLQERIKDQPHSHRVLSFTRAGASASAIAIEPCALALCARCITHVSIQLIITRPFTILHLLNVCPLLPQSVFWVKAVKDDDPTRKRMNEMVSGTRCARIPNARWLPRSWNPMIRATERCQSSSQYDINIVPPPGDPTQPSLLSRTWHASDTRFARTLCPRSLAWLVRSDTH